MLNYPLQRRIREETAVPVVLTLDLDGWETWRERPACDYVFGADFARGVVKIDEVARAHVYGADAEARFTRIDALEIDELFQSRLEELGLIKACGFEATARVQPRGGLA